MAKLAGSNDFEKLKSLCAKPYKEQAVWFLNAFWDTFAEKESEKLWKFVEKITKLDLQNGVEGCEVDEMKAHQFLEHFQETMTVREMRDTLRETGAIVGTPKMIPLTHMLIFRYKADWHTLVNAAQGDNSDKIEKAQKMLDEVQRSFREAESKSQQAKDALKKAENAEADAKKREAEAKASEAQAKTKQEESRAREAESRAAQEELEKALKELHDQEEAFRKRKEELETRSNDESTGVVQRNKAKNELSQHLAKDPLPLSRAKITQEAAVKKADKATQAASEARTAAEAAAVQATKDRSSAEQASKQAVADRQASAVAKEQAEAAADEAARKVEEAEAYLEEVKNQPGCAHGSIFWLNRELKEAKAYMPERKGGYRKDK